MKAMKRALATAIAVVLVLTLALPAMALDRTTANVYLAMNGVVTVTNAEGKTLTYHNLDRTTNGTMEVFDSLAFPAAPGMDALSMTMFTVPGSETFTFTSSVPRMEATVSGEVYLHAESKTAQVVKFTDNARAVEIIGEGEFDYRLFLSDNNETLYDTVNVTGKANGSASLALNEDGSVLLSGVAAGAELSVNHNHHYAIPAGHNKVLLNGSADDVKGYAADGTPIELQRPIVDLWPLKWWQRQPVWVQWILRYLCFGWIWMK